MRLLNIFGNSIRKRLIAAVNVCCSFLWEDSLEWTDRCKWKEPSCCSSSTWENTQTWTNACTWALPPEQPEQPEDSPLWIQDEEWGDDERWNNSPL